MDVRQITPLIITRNEEANIARALAGVRWAANIVIVDSFSTDATVAVASSCPNVRIVQRQFDTFADQCNFGVAQIRTPWVLSLDADYVCGPDLARELDGLRESAHDGFSAAFRYCMNGRPLRASLYPPRVVLYRRDAARYENEGHGHRVRVHGSMGQLRSKIDHDDRKPLDAWLDSQRRYAVREADALLNASVRLNWVDALRRRVWIMPLLTPIHCLLMKGLLFDGAAGWRYTFERTYFEITLALELLSRGHRTSADGA